MTDHLVILKKAYLELILSGRKTIELRLSRGRSPLIGRVRRRDELFVKIGAGPVCARATVAEVKCYETLTPVLITQIKQKYNDQIMGGDAVWDSMMDRKSGLLVWLRDVQPHRADPDGEKGLAGLGRAQTGQGFRPALQNGHIGDYRWCDPEERAVTVRFHVYYCRHHHRHRHIIRCRRTLPGGLRRGGAFWRSGLSVGCSRWRVTRSWRRRTRRQAGGDYVYLTKAYGRWAGFLFGWAQFAVVRPGRYRRPGVRLRHLRASDLRPPDGQ